MLYQEQSSAVISIYHKRGETLGQNSAQGSVLAQASTEDYLPWIGHKHSGISTVNNTLK